MLRQVYNRLFAQVGLVFEEGRPAQPIVQAYEPHALRIALAPPQSCGELEAIGGFEEMVSRNEHGQQA